MLIFTEKEKALMRRKNTPSKIQDFLNSLKFNFEVDAKGMEQLTIKSPILVLRTRSAHCLEGALLGAYMLSIHGFSPLLVHLKAGKKDFDHVIAPFKIGGYYGALSKTNHAVLRYREPVYKSLRELVMSYFHEYFLDSGEKTLREYSRPLNLNIFEKNWMTSEENLWGIDEELDKIKHYKTVPKFHRAFRKADKVEIQAGKIIEFKR